MGDDRVRELIVDYLNEATMMQLATSRNGQPWVCNVWFAADAALNIYWFSATTRRHSEEIQDNELVAGAIVLPQTPRDEPRGLQLEGTAKVLADDAEIAKARLVYEDRIFPGDKIDELMTHAERPHSFY